MEIVISIVGYFKGYSESSLILCIGYSSGPGRSSISCHYLTMLDSHSYRASPSDTPWLPRMGWMGLHVGLGCLLRQSPFPPNWSSNSGRHDDWFRWLLEGAQTAQLNLAFRLQRDWKITLADIRVPFRQSSYRVISLMWDSIFPRLPY